METGILHFKGRVHFAIGKCINESLKEIRHLTDKVDIVRRVCALIDNEIHHGYRIYPINYIAYDRVNQTSRFAHEYTADDEARFDEYLSRQLDKVDLPDISEEERGFMKTRILEMYANPLRNRLAAGGTVVFQPICETTPVSTPRREKAGEPHAQGIYR